MVNDIKCDCLLVPRANYYLVASWFRHTLTPHTEPSLPPLNHQLDLLTTSWRRLRGPFGTVTSSSHLFSMQMCDQNQHTRATVHEMIQVNCPSLQATETPFKDNPAHWYTAQLVNYGLQNTKNKGTAKKRIWHAFCHGKLAGPAAITTLAVGMKRQWAAENRKVQKPAHKPPTSSGHRPELCFNRTLQ